MRQTGLMIVALTILALASCGAPPQEQGSPQEASVSREAGSFREDPGLEFRVTDAPLFVYTRGTDRCPDVPGGGRFCGSDEISSGLYDVAAVDRDGRAHTLTDDHISIGGRLSPDGSRIAFISGGRIVEDRNGDVAARYSLYVMGSGGDDRRRLADLGLGYVDGSSDGGLEWSPDGERIAFESSEVGSGEVGSGGVWVVDTDGEGQPEQLAPHGYDPAWSPDGKRIAFTGPDSTVEIVDVDGGEIGRLAPPRRGAHGTPEFSPDGELIAFVNEPSHTRESTLLVANAGDAAPGFAEATNAAEVEATEPEPLFREEAPDFSGFRDLEWSPDSKMIAFGGVLYKRGAPQDRAVVGTVGLGDQRFRPLEVGRPGTLGFFPNVEWTPDGRHVVYIGPASPTTLVAATPAGEKAPAAEAPGIFESSFNYSDYDWGPYTLDEARRP